MVPGYNHNVKHRGKAYHVQTEDSGLTSSRIVSHLFVGGNVLASKKTSYAELRGAENLTRIVRELMEDQHKELLRNLVSGVYDEEASSSAARSYQPGELAAGAAGGAHAPAPDAAAGYIALRMNVGAPAPAPTERPAVPSPPQAPPPPLPAILPEPVLQPGLAETQLLSGDDLASERSLDQVILSYLAEGDSK